MSDGDGGCWRRGVLNLPVLGGAGWGVNRRRLDLLLQSNVIDMGGGYGGRGQG